MDAAHFDRLTRSLTAGSSRRTLWGVLAALALAGTALPDVAEAKKGQKRKKKLKRNAFGCVNVGQKCRGKDSVCCSGICQGKKPKKGEKDKSKCVAHDASTCQVGQHNPFCGGAATVLCTTTAGKEGACVTTTGNAGYCWASGGCFPCGKDADCEPFCGPGAACYPCAALCAAKGGTACAGISQCTFP